MKLLAVYTLFVITGEFVAYGIGRIVEYWSMTAGLPVFLAGFFVVFWVAWRAAIKIA